ncbi:MAG: hypothetical protein HKL92_05575 [Candidatus Eremiobacteraeota bacterium]|nr:hypothetical protein [Candidatus Eremiobacteraeota bacterium]NNM92795.1 hypothetical protein [Candidatus Eremiobacteraeota bacterium]
MRSAFVLLFFVAAAALAACGGGASSSLPVTDTPTSTSARPSAALTLHFPAPSTASSARSPRYLSQNTTSVTITITAVNGVAPSPAIPPTTIAVAPGQGSCTAVVSGGFSCTATVGAVAGNDTFLIQAYDSSGTLLSSGSFTVAVNPTGTTTVTTPLVLGGVSASTSLVAPSPGPQSDGSALTTSGTWVPPADGTPRTLTISVVAKDASGNIIVGPLATPIPIALTDPSGGTLSESIVPSANASGATITAVPTTVTLTYSGAAFYSAASPAPGTLALGSGSGAPTIAIAPLQVTPSTSLANATVGTPFTVTATEANATTLTFTATAASSGGTFEAACPGATPPPSGATTLSCTTSSGSVAFNVAPTGLGTGGSLAISDANGVDIKQPFDVTPRSGGGITVPPHTIREFPDLSVANATGLSVGPNGNHIWFGGSNGSMHSFSPANCALSPTSCISNEALLPGTSHYPVNFASYQGLLWYTDASANGIFNLAPSSACSGTTPVTCTVTTSLSAGSSVTGDFVISNSGFMLFSTQIAEYYSYSPISQSWTTVSEPNQPVQAALGPNGNAFLTERPTGSVAALGEITSPGSPSTDFSYNSLTFCATTGQLADPYNDLSGLATGSDGNLWVVEATSRKVDVLSTVGTTPCVVAQYSLPAPIGTATIPNVYSVVDGPDGNIWITDPPNNSIDRITPSGAVTAISIPTGSANPYDIIVGPDGNLWFTEYNAPNIGEIVLQ